MYKNLNKRKMLLNTILVIVGIIGLLYFSKRNKEKDQTIIQNAAYTKGEIIEFYSSVAPVIAPGVVHSTGKPNRVKYQFSVDDKILSNQYPSYKGLRYIPDANPDTMIGNKYLVIYNKRKPKDSRILFNYPIRDSADFKRYIKQLSK